MQAGRPLHSIIGEDVRVFIVNYTGSANEVTDKANADAQFLRAMSNNTVTFSDFYKITCTDYTVDKQGVNDVTGWVNFNLVGPVTETSTGGSDQRWWTSGTSGDSWYSHAGSANPKVFYQDKLILPAYLYDDPEVIDPLTAVYRGVAVNFTALGLNTGAVNLADWKFSLENTVDYIDSISMSNDFPLEQIDVNAINFEDIVERRTKRGAKTEEGSLVALAGTQVYLLDDSECYAARWRDLEHLFKAIYGSEWTALTGLNLTNENALDVNSNPFAIRKVMRRKDEDDVGALKQIYYTQYGCYLSRFHFGEASSGNTPLQVEAAWESQYARISMEAYGA
jgi:hypothetical protein